MENIQGRGGIFFLLKYHFVSVQVRFYFIFYYLLSFKPI